MRHTPDCRHGRRFDVHRPAAEGKHPLVVQIRAFECGEGKLSADEALAIDGRHSAVELFAAPCSRGGDRRRDDHERGILDLLELFDRLLVECSGRSHWAAEEFHRPGHRPHG
jgi:hypothetical protein